ncbi:CocE/NonD family hydrolase [Streptomyces sp. RK31]|uniref:CocE/NonD family hydrolase n=1 Tax=Streptomyces sp. RK31 TaxID=2824892 RepID=UPI001B37BF54|nr:CocE/NonD family hydrolase [Streptomyces sp. RK31]MBQ0976416.1 CocE/NonD family hydrolase [Streptomyces sp. RK31]
MVDVREVLRFLGGHAVSQVTQRVMRLPSPRPRTLNATRPVTVPAPGRRTIEAGQWAPATPEGPLPTLLVATPYDRGPLCEALLTRPYTERGFRVVLAVSSNSIKAGAPNFSPARGDREEVLAVVDWILRQQWFDGSLALTGPSYLGYIQWTVAYALPLEVKALVPQVTSSRLPRSSCGPGTIALDSALRWSLLVDAPHRHGPLRALLGFTFVRLHDGLKAIPIKDADLRSIGRRLPHFQLLVQHHDGANPFWLAWDSSEQMSDVTIPVSLVAAWFDLFVAGQLRDYEKLRAAGHHPRLTVGPGTHLGIGTLAAAVRETIAWAGAQCGHPQSRDPAPVRLYMLGGGDWKDFDQWPPAGTMLHPWYMRAGGHLAAKPPHGHEPADLYRFAPARPTPSVGGPLLPRGACRHNDYAVESRSDVLTYTSAPLSEDLEVIGEITAVIWLRASQPGTNFFVRWHDRRPTGSRAVCDALVRVRPDREPSPNSSGPVRVSLGPTANLRRRHRLRLQVSGQSYPRFAPGVGGDEPLADDTVLKPWRHCVFHDADHPSALLHPVCPTVRSQGPPSDAPSAW